ncbi:MAG: hypothetical protein ACC618_02615 [Patescibacteria group bacterium]
MGAQKSLIFFAILFYGEDASFAWERKYEQEEECAELVRYRLDPVKWRGAGVV